MECSDINYCMNCDHDPDVGCYPIKNYPLIRVSEFGNAFGDEQIMAEIYARGPVSAAINAECLETYTGGINMYGKFYLLVDRTVTCIDMWLDLYFRHLQDK